MLSANSELLKATQEANKIRLDLLKRKEQREDTKLQMKISSAQKERDLREMEMKVSQAKMIAGDDKLPEEVRKKATDFLLNYLSF